MDGTATIRSSGFPPRNAPNSIRRPCGVSRSYSGQISHKQTSGSFAGEEGIRARDRIS
jgi:hypothetical protein